MKRELAKNKAKAKKRVIGFQVLEYECIWMKAGIVNFRVCDNAYDCNSCPFDKGIRRAMGLGEDFETAKHAPEWVDYNGILRHLVINWRQAINWQMAIIIIWATAGRASNMEAELKSGLTILQSDSSVRYSL
ncbi:MAG: hypothetical protein P8Y40_09160 [Desulfobacterales bacterium]